MPAAVAVPLIVGAAGAASSIAAAKIGSNAANKASQAQIDSTHTAQDFNNRVFDYQRQITAPYISAGQTSLANLMAQRWGGSPSDYAQPAPQAGAWGGNGGGGGWGGPGGGVSLGGWQDGGMVPLQAPDGTVKHVPAALAEQFIAKGAHRIGASRPYGGPVGAMGGAY